MLSKIKQGKWQAAACPTIWPSYEIP